MIRLCLFTIGLTQLDLNKLEHLKIFECDTFVKFTKLI